MVVGGRGFQQTGDVAGLLPPGLWGGKTEQNERTGGNERAEPRVPSTLGTQQAALCPCRGCVEALGGVTCQVLVGFRVVPVYPSLPPRRVWRPRELGAGREDPPAAKQDRQVSGRRQPGQGWQGAGSWSGAREAVFGPGGQAAAGSPGRGAGGGSVPAELPSFTAVLLGGLPSCPLSLPAPHPSHLCPSFHCLPILFPPRCMPFLPFSPGSCRLVAWFSEETVFQGGLPRPLRVPLHPVHGTLCQDPRLGVSMCAMVCLWLVSPTGVEPLRREQVCRVEAVSPALEVASGT